MPLTSTYLFMSIQSLSLHFFIETWITVAFSGPLKTTQQVSRGGAKQSQVSQYHFIHVGKTGGTSVKAALEKCVNTSIVQGLHGGSVAHGHYGGADYLYATYSTPGENSPEGEDLIVA